MKTISLAILKLAVALHRKVLLSIIRAAEVRAEGAEYIARKTEEAAKQARGHAFAASIERDAIKDQTNVELADLPLFH